MLSFSAGTSKNKKYRSTELLMEVTISLYTAIQHLPHFCFYLFYCHRKEKDHIRRNMNSESKNIYVRS